MMDFSTYLTPKGFGVLAIRISFMGTHLELVSFFGLESGIALVRLVRYRICTSIKVMINRICGCK